jgi:6,7-dimethyl-8-ribityllumazine synthase
VSDAVKIHAAAIDASELRFAVVAARFNHLISVRLLEGCTDELLRRGAAPGDIEVVWVPGAFEIPQAARLLAATGRYSAIITVGAVIRGGTPHFDFVCGGLTDGVREVIRDTGVPVAFGVLTTNTVDQALARAGGEEGNKGCDVAAAAIEMAHLRLSLAGGDGRPA